ncbi:caffeine-induced death protein 2-domain-containing protein [Suillus fuscotomentosus]|uniref:Caffeine-induced death protein 2-domain-containing protein n=1 Tax=Suillus fuscotomentosus TaxID=1912939 RepID=A0AAD4HSK0_9AGAM|nr:caffeine-induced death protein 2-domain-containing protein [Suillus fuscotomentosus]KAG1907197.1 caffeine-induced death protein 2-domain-containing protein [Suillus fuscotomentosus]
MPSKQPPTLGSLALQATPHLVHVSPSTCHNLSMFKDLLKEYRRLDDTITMRLNRSNAQFRDRDRAGTSGKGNIQDQACAYVWKELVENWKRRTEMINYCVDVVDQSMEEKRKSLTSEEGDVRAQRKTQAAMFADEVKRNQVHNELAIEKIVRQRSLDAFRSRCQYFSPPLTDSEARKWWDAVHIQESP